MSDKGAIDMLEIDQLSTWDQIRKIQKPLITAVLRFALGGGLHLKRKNFYLLFASEDQKEGMQAFIEKREPNFKGN